MTWVLRVLVIAGMGVACSGDDTDTTPATDVTDPTDATGETGTDTGTPPATPFESFTEADLTRASVIRGLHEASAPNVFALPYAFAFSATSGADKTCPTEVKSGTTTTYTGGCTDKDGNAWTGVMEISSNKATQMFGIDYQEFGVSGTVDCTKAGTVNSRTMLDGQFEFNNGDSFVVRLGGTITDTDLDACTSSEAQILMDYAGVITTVGGDKKGPGKKADTASVWSGEGKWAHSLYGKVDVATYGEIYDGPCGDEAESGATVFWTTDHTAVMLYDGQIDCDPEGTVEWLLDGVSQGEIDGVDCSTGGTGAGLGALLASLLFIRRRRD